MFKPMLRVGLLHTWVCRSPFFRLLNIESHNLGSIPMRIFFKMPVMSKYIYISKPEQQHIYIYLIYNTKSELARKNDLYA